MAQPTPAHEVAVCFIDALDEELQRRSLSRSAFLQVAAGFRTKWAAGGELGLPLGANPYLDRIATAAVEATGTTWGDSELHHRLAEGVKQRVDALPNVSVAHRAAAADILARWPGGDRGTFLAAW